MLNGLFVCSTLLNLKRYGETSINPGKNTFFSNSICSVISFIQKCHLFLLIQFINLDTLPLFFFLFILLYLFVIYLVYSKYSVWFIRLKYLVYIHPFIRCSFHIKQKTVLHLKLLPNNKSKKPRCSKHLRAIAVI